MKTEGFLPSAFVCVGWARDLGLPGPLVGGDTNATTVKAIRAAAGGKQLPQPEVDAGARLHVWVGRTWLNNKERTGADILQGTTGLCCVWF